MLLEFSILNQTSNDLEMQSATLVNKSQGTCVKPGFQVGWAALSMLLETGES